MKDAIWRQVLPLLPGKADYQPTVLARPDFGLDALDFVELVLQVEQHFCIRFSDAELNELRVVQQLLQEVERPRRRALYVEFFALLLQNGQWL